MIPRRQIRNFAIVAHIDHGKSTLSDRIMEMTNTVDQRESKDQLLDDMAVEQSHKITVKSRTVRNLYQAQDGLTYELNLIDTPGHVDFNYEVSRSLTASDGIILLVDATQGVQAQTVANFRLAKRMGLPMIPVINKIDGKGAQVDRTRAEIQALEPGFTTDDFIYISAKTGKNVAQVLEAIVQRIPAPTGNDNAPLKALIFDSKYDQFQGVVILIRLIDGVLTNDARVLHLMQKRIDFKIQDLGILSPNMQPIKQLHSGEVGYVVTGIKDPDNVRVGDTLTNKLQPTLKALTGYQEVKPTVFAGIYPKNTNYKDLKMAIEKLALNDPSFQYLEETSEALGPGFRGGFLGMFHLQIIQERLHDEYNIDVLITAPNVNYHVYLTHRKNPEEYLTITNPVAFPAFNQIDYVKEPFVKAEITTPNNLLSNVMKLATEYRGTLIDLYNSQNLVTVTYKMPLGKIAYEFFNQLKSASHGYATLNTAMLDYEVADLVKVEIDVNYSPVDALAFIVYRSEAPALTQKLVKRLKYTMPKKLYPTPVQAIVEGKAIAREDVPPLRKNAAVNGEKHSISKKQALLRRQSINKRRAAHTQIKLPQAVFNTILEL